MLLTLKPYNCTLKSLLCVAGYMVPTFKLVPKTNLVDKTNTKIVILIL